MGESIFDILVVGGGHAGSEAALVAARMGCRTALITFSADGIGKMSCNPAIGGLGKGQLVKEIDALFGEMGAAIDETGIQFRMLNSSKGPAVRSSRAQADRDLYKNRILKAVQTCPNLTIVEAEVAEILCSGNEVLGLSTACGLTLSARATILTTGTFLQALMHTGEQKTKGGRVDENASNSLSDSIKGLGLKMGRMKTGTPPRLRRDSINFEILEEQPGDDPIRPFSFRTAEIKRKQISCWLTSTTARTHEIIAANVERSPMFNGQISSIGPRYCPSIEDKVFRFRDKTSHGIFLEPEGFDSNIVYPNGISTSLPLDVQQEFVRTIVGLEEVEILRPGYAVEYDHVQPTELNRTLSPKSISGIYFAGQINGTSGYEEAGAQGIIAGINAALFVKEREPFILGRDEAYIGVMIDDLTTLGVMEPYRMFTSRAEYRLHLREDNADRRLTPFARDFGLVNDAEWARYQERMERIDKEKKRLETTFIKPTVENNEWLKESGTRELQDSISLATLIKRPEITYQRLVQLSPAPQELNANEGERVETELKFVGYLKRQDEDIKRLQKMESIRIPRAFSFESVSGLSVEVQQRLAEVRPDTLGQAARISGVTPAAVSLLGIYLRRQEKGA